VVYKELRLPLVIDVRRAIEIWNRDLVVEASIDYVVFNDAISPDNCDTNGLDVVSCAALDDIVPHDRIAGANRNASVLRFAGNNDLVSFDYNVATFRVRINAGHTRVRNTSIRLEGIALCDVIAERQILDSSESVNTAI
jgi:hypothetical protein